MVKQETVLALDTISHWFEQGDRRIDVLQNVNLALRRGEKVALIGRSGAGKSTLLHIACLLECPRKGDVVIAGRSVSALRDHQRARIRGRYLGFIYQYHHLLADFSAQENVMLASLLNGGTKRHARAQAQRLLAELGLSGRLTHKPAQLSGGEQQRVAFARAIINQPKVLLADEPTGNLDSETGKDVLQRLLQLAREQDMALIIATHDTRLATTLDRVVVLQEGQLAERAATN